MDFGIPFFWEFFNFFEKKVHTMIFVVVNKELFMDRITALDLWVARYLSFDMVLKSYWR